MRARARIVASSFLATGLTLLPAAAAHADGGKGDGGGGTPTLSAPLASGLAGPLQIAVGKKKDVWVAQGFAGLATRLDRRGGSTSMPVANIDGIDEREGKVVVTTRAGAPGPPGPGFSATLEQLKSDGTTQLIADLWAYEQAANPDAGNTYGFESIDADCAAQLPAELGPPQYPGQLDSNPFGVLLADNGRTYIADAGGNALLSADRRGKVRTVAVLPPQPAVIDAAAAGALGLPACAVGLTYRFEPVPTDVEMGRDGMLYVTTLPGGPEDPSLGARGAVWKVNPRTGSVKQIAAGFLGATNLAIGSNGTIYVSEIFAGRISKVVHGGPVGVVDLPTPSGLEYANGRLYVSYDVLGPDGKVATIDLRGDHHRGDDGDDDD